MSRRLVSIVGATAALAVGPYVSAASLQTITQWNFNKFNQLQTASTGAGTLAVQGGMSFLTSLSTDVSGSPGDTTPQPDGFNHSQGMNGTATPATATVAAAASGSVGLKIAASTANYTDIKVSWHVAQGYRGSRYYQLYATSNGTTFTPVSGGTGSSAANLGGVSGDAWYDSLSVDNSGLVEVHVRDGKILPASGLPMGYELSYTFPSGSVYENNPNFAVVLASAYAPGGSDYVSSFAGTTNLADSAKGYLRNGSSTGGGLRYDLITVSGIPEPTSLALAGLGGTFALRRRRR